MVGDSDGAELSGKDLVVSLLRDLDEAAQRWEDRLAEAESTTYGVDLGDVTAVANVDGRLVGLHLDSSVARYNHHELADRLNLAFGALHREARADFERRYGGGPCL